MNRCPECGNEDKAHIAAVEYAYGSPERYDGISEWECLGCGYRQGRWTGKKLEPGFIEPRFGRGWKPVPLPSLEP